MIGLYNNNNNNNLSLISNILYGNVIIYVFPFQLQSRTINNNAGVLRRKLFSFSVFENGYRTKCHIFKESHGS